MKDEISDLLDAVFKDGNKKTSSYQKSLDASTKNTEKAWDMLKKLNISSGDLSKEIDRQNEELKRLAREMDSDTICLPDEDTQNVYKTEEKKESVIPQKSNEEIISAFNGVIGQAITELVGQDRFLAELIIAFKRPFVAGPAKNSALNTILVTGANGTGKHSAVNLITQILNKRGVISSPDVFTVDMELYPSQDEAGVFLHDLYIALESDARVVVFNNAEKAHPALIMMLSDLIKEGKLMLNSRYVAQRGMLVESGKALTKEAVSSLSVKNQYIIVITENSPRKMSEVFGTGFSESLGDVCTTQEFTDEALYIIAQKAADKLKIKAQTQLKMNVSFTQELIKLIKCNFNTEQGVHAILDFSEAIYRALSEYKLRNYDEIKPNSSFIISQKDGRVNLKADENKAVAEGGKADEANTDSETIDLSALLPARSMQELTEVKAELEKIVGLTEVKKYVLSLEDNFKVQARRRAIGMKTEITSMHMIFTGNPGTGKTTMARIVAKYLKAVGILSGGQLVEVTRADLVGRYVGHTAPLTTSVIKSAYGGVLFIDEAYSLYRGENDSYGLEAIDTIVKCMEEYRDEMVFILAGYTKEMAEFLTANSGLKSRFPNIIEFPDYSGDELTQIALSIAESKGYMIENQAVKPLTKYFNTVQTFNAKSAGNGRLARNKVEEAILNQAARIVDLPTASLSLLLKEDFDFDDIAMN